MGTPINRPSAPNLDTTYRPDNMGSITPRPSQPITRPGGVTPGPGGGNWGATQGPGGGMMIGHQRPGGGGSIGAVGPGGATGGAISGPGGGAVGGIRGPGGGSAGGVRGPQGGAAGGIRGPQGGAGGVIRGPAGGAVGGVRGPGGGAAVGGRTPWGGSGSISRLPEGSRNVNWHGNNYWHNNGHWYHPYWHGGAVWYWPMYPPVGYWMPSSDWSGDDSNPVVINNNTYYESDGAYYQKTTQDGQEGYTVVEEPKQAVVGTETDVPDPFDVLKKDLDYMAKLPQFSMNVADCYDEVSEDGQKVSYTTERDMFVRRPGNAAIDYRADGQSRRTVLDNKNLTFVDREKKAYGQAPAAATIDETLDKVANDYGVTVAAAELLRTNLYDRIYQNIQTGQYLGKDSLYGVECDHLGFVTPEVDYELWFQTGDKPLLRKVSMRYKNMPTKPRYTMNISKYDLSGVKDDQLKVVIPEGFQKVDLPPVQQQGAPAGPATPAAPAAPAAPAR